MTFQIRGESDKSSSMLLSVRLNFSLSLKVFMVLNVMKVGMEYKMEESANKGGGWGADA